MVLGSRKVELDFGWGMMKVEASMALQSTALSSCSAKSELAVGSWAKVELAAGWELPEEVV